jgi:DNA adenine methylase
MKDKKIEKNYKFNAKPILKWAGGKSQLLPTLNEHFPEKLIRGNIVTYIEPFVGGGASFFEISNIYNFSDAYLFDINPELIILYNSVKNNVESVIFELEKLSEKYLSLQDEKERKEQFYTVREQYNLNVIDVYEIAKSSSTNELRAAQTLFLNRVCFNGLFRVNRKGEFNVPHGRYKNPRILDKNKLIYASNALQQATIKLVDFSSCLEYADKHTFMYYDPPYRPLNKTSSFNSYAKDQFGDDEQIRLSKMYRQLDKKGVLQLLSNSDPKNHSDDSFFDDLYKGFNINRVAAKRAINSNPEKRGNLTELLIRNY